MLLVASVSSFFSFYELLPLPLYIYLTSTVYIYWYALYLNVIITLSAFKYIK